MTYEETLALYMENPTWKEALETCPSEACRRYMEDGLVNGFYCGDDPAHPTARLERPLTAEDWKHLKKYAGNTPFKTKCRKMIESMTADQ